MLPVQPLGSRPPLFWIGAGPFIRPLSKRLGNDQPLLGLTFKSSDPEDHIIPYSLGTIARCFVDTVQQVHPVGPCFLGGHCLSGVVAYEVARQLLVEGRNVALLVLLEADGEAFRLVPNLPGQNGVSDITERLGLHRLSPGDIGPRQVLRHVYNRATLVEGL